LPVLVLVIWYQFKYTYSKAIDRFCGSVRKATWISI